MLHFLADCHYCFPFIFVSCDKVDIISIMFRIECSCCICCRITTQARSLLRLIPTDPSVVEALDSISQKVRFCSCWCSVDYLHQWTEYCSCSNLSICLAVVLLFRS